MAISVVPVIYDRATKQVLRWYILDSESQRSDPAFNPHFNEGKLDIFADIFNSFGKSPNGTHALQDIQSYIKQHAP